MSLGINLAFRDNLILDKKENSRNNEIKFLKNFKKICDEKFKLELVNAIPEQEMITFYRQGNFLDLCRGPHAPSTKKLGHSFK